MNAIIRNKVMPFLGATLALAMVAVPVRADASEHMGGTMMDESKDATGRQQAMHKSHMAMMAEMKTQDDELAALVAKMNKASNSKKVDLLATLVTRMTEQRAAMTQHMTKMNDGMKMPMDGCCGNKPQSMMKEKQTTEPMEMK